MTKEITIIDADGKFGRMDFRPLFLEQDWAAMRPLVSQAMGEEAAALIQSLPRHDTHKGRQIGWWLPRAFQVKHCVCRIPDELTPTADGLGWIAAVALASHKKALLQVCDQHPLLNILGHGRLDTRQTNAEIHGDWKLNEYDPFEGIAGARKMLAPLARIEEQNADDVLAMQGTVIYNPDTDAYLDFQAGWRQLNRARVFPTRQEAEEIIQQRRLTGCMTATVGLRVEAFSDPRMVGAKARQALSEREAQSMEEATPYAGTTTTRTPRRI